MPSADQPQGSSEWANEYDKMLHKPNGVLAGIIEGIRRPEECQRYLEAEVNGQCRQDVIGALNRKKAELEVPEDA